MQCKTMDVFGLVLFYGMTLILLAILLQNVIISPLKGDIVILAEVSGSA